MRLHPKQDVGEALHGQLFFDYHRCLSRHFAGQHGDTAMGGNGSLSFEHLGSVADNIAEVRSSHV